MSIYYIGIIIGVILIMFNLLYSTWKNGDAEDIFIGLLVGGLASAFVLTLTSLIPWKDEWVKVENLEVILGQGEIIVYADKQRFILTTLKEAEKVQNDKQAYLVKKYSISGGDLGTKLIK